MQDGTKNIWGWQWDWVFLSDLRYTWEKELSSHLIVQEVEAQEFNDSSKVKGVLFLKYLFVIWGIIAL